MATFTFFNNTPLTINTGNQTSKITSSVHGEVKNVSIVLFGLTHSYVDDLDMLLTGPDDANNLLFMSDVGGDGAPNNVTLMFSDAGSKALTQEPGLIQGSYRPTDYEQDETGSQFGISGSVNSPLDGHTFGSAFAGSSSGGTWTLHALDDLGGFNGSLQGWSVSITVAEDIPTVQGTSGADSYLVSWSSSNSGFYVLNGQVVQFSGVEGLRFEGGNNADFITGGDGVDIVNDGQGGDVVDLGGGNDTLIMGDANINGDSFYGGAGIDTFDVSHFGWALAVTIDLTAEVWSFSTGSEAVVGFENIYGGTGNSGSAVELLRGNALANVLRGNGGNDILEGMAGADTLDGGDDNDTAAYWQAPAGVIASLATPSINTGHAAGDVYISIENLSGSAFNDRLYGDGAANVLTGNAGNDLLHGGAGADHLVGGDGVDGAAYWEASSGVWASLADPSINTGDAAGDTYDSIENLYGSAFDDQLYGDAGANALVGNNGDDVLHGGAGADQLIGGNGTDTASYRNASSAVTASLANPSINTGDAAGDTYSSIENIYGGAYFDDLYGDAGDNSLWGEGGNDNLYGGDGDDTLYGGTGFDVMYGGAGADTFYGGVNNDIAAYTSSPLGVIASLANSSINTGEAAGDVYHSIESLLGSAFADRLYGDGGANTLVGGGGNDLLHGGAGADTLNGGMGTDGAAYWEATSGVTASLANASANTGDAAGDTYLSIENLYGSAFADRLYGDAGANALIGNDGNDLLHGGAGADALNGGSGIDGAAYWDASTGVNASLITPASNTGDAAGDTYNSIENLYGSAFADQLRGDNGANALIGNNGDDILYGFGGSDDLYGGNGADRLVGGLGNDRLWGGADADIFYGVNDNGIDRIEDWQDGIDLVNLGSVSGVSSFAQLTVTNGVGGALVTWNGGVDGFLVVGQNASVIGASDFVF